MAIPGAGEKHSGFVKGGCLREQAADQGGFGDPADGQDHGARARRNGYD